jgi:hypothetical protein
MDDPGRKYQRNAENCSFLKKRTKRLLFLRRRQDPGHSLDLGSGGDLKSLLLLFFRKKDAFSKDRFCQLTFQPET